MGHIAKASGQVTEHEIRVASNLMDRDASGWRAAGAGPGVVPPGQGARLPAAETLAEFRQASLGQRDILRFFLEVQLQAAFADGQVEANERPSCKPSPTSWGSAASSWPGFLAMAEAQMNFFHRQQQGSGQGSNTGRGPSGTASSDAYQLLGVSESDSDQEIKRAYRKEMSKHLPDKLAARGCRRDDGDEPRRSSRLGSGSERPAASVDSAPAPGQKRFFAGSWENGS